jgi:hypothetical protein
MDASTRLRVTRLPHTAHARARAMRGGISRGTGNRNRHVVDFLGLFRLPHREPLGNPVTTPEPAGSTSKLAPPNMRQLQAMDWRGGTRLPANGAGAMSVKCGRGNDAKTHDLAAGNRVESGLMTRENRARDQSIRPGRENRKRRSPAGLLVVSGAPRGSGTRTRSSIMARNGAGCAYSPS